MGELKKWLDEDWVRIDSEGNIAGECGTSKNKKNPDRCLPRKKAQSLSKSERKATARKKKQAGSKGKQFVANTPKAKVKKAKSGGRCMRDGLAVRGRTRA
jgi:sRNA-binding protein